jgi:hypothetical protein
MSDRSEIGAESGKAESANDRAANRARVLKRGVLTSAGGFVSHPCIVRNQSASGAKIELLSPQLLVGELSLHIELDGTHVACRRVWQRGLLIGLLFVGDKQRSRLAKSQLVSTSENALPKQFRGGADAASPSTPALHAVSEPQCGPGAPARSFGKRRTDR